MSHDEGAVPMSEVTRRALLVRGAQGAGTLGLAWALDACGGSGVKSSTARFKAPPPGGGRSIPLLTFGIIGDPVSMDYTHTYDNQSLTVVPSMTEPLFLYDEHVNLQPNLATSYHYADPLTVVLKLRPGVHFHDGSLMTADDVAFSMNRHLDPKVGSLVGFYYGRVASIAASGPLEVTVRLKQPDSQFVPALTTAAGMVTSRAFVQKLGKAFGTASGGTMGTGPYRFVSWQSGQQVELERFPDYWNTSRAHKVQRFVARVLKDEATIVSALTTGELDGSMPGISGRGLNALASTRGLAFNRAPFLGGYFLGLNCQEKPFDDPRVRRAMAYALNPAALLKATYGSLGQEVKTLAPPAMWSFDRSQWSAAYKALPDYANDLGKAKGLAAQAIPQGAKGTLMYATDRTSDAILASAIQQAAAEIGIRLSIHAVNETQLVTAIGTHPRPYSILMNYDSADIPDPANNYATTFDSSASNNVMGYKNPKVDAALRAQRLTTDPGTRTRQLLAAQSLIVRDCPIIPSYSPDNVMVQRSKVGGYKLTPTWLWYPWIADLSGS